MNINKSKLRFWEGYKSIVTVFHSHIQNEFIYPELNKILDLFIDNLEISTKYMLYERFDPASQKKDSESKKKTKSISKDMKLVLDIPVAVQTEQIVEPKDVIKYFKLLENYILKRKYSSSIEDLKLGKLRNSANKVVTSLPKLLLDVDNLDAEHRRVYLNLIFSVVTIYRQFKVKTIPDSTTISAPYNGENLDQITFAYFQDEDVLGWLSFLDKNLISKFAKLHIYSGNASSPNGGAASSNLMADVAAVSNDRVLWESILSLSSNFEGFKEFELLIKTMKLNIDIDTEYLKNKVHSRLFHFTAPGGKARIIANVDWVTQTALSAIHFTSFKILSLIPSDCTFNHASGIELYTSPNSNYYSIDLSAATDRLPRTLQAAILKNIWSYLGKDGVSIASNWLKVVDREYSTAKSKINNGEPIRYAVGQGMGLFSSWTSMALLHHYIVNCICKIPFSDYRIVGDDLLIKDNTDGYHKYLNFMKSIGVEVNPHKTVESSNTDKHNIEFARNYIISGVRVHPYNFGTYFAHITGKVSFATAIWSFRNNLNKYNMSNFLLLNNESDRNTYMFYYIYLLYKSKIWDMEEWWWISPVYYKQPWWFTKDLVMKVESVCSENTNSKKIYNEFISSSDFMATFRSQCTVRNDKQCELTKEVANAISLLGFIDDELYLLSNKIFNRLSEVNVISFDTDTTGTPMVSSREKVLLSELCHHYTGHQITRP